MLLENFLKSLYFLKIAYVVFGRIKTDDRMIQAEGIESLSERELVMACRDRGLLRPMSVEEMRQEVCT